MEERLVSSNNFINNDDFLQELMVVGNNPQPLIEKFESTNVSSLSQNSFEIVDAIKNTELINETDVNNIKKAHNFLLASYKDVPIYNTRIAKVTSILSDGKFSTNDAKFWQCKMQAEVHFNELVRSIFKLDRVKIDLEEIQYQIYSIDSILEGKTVENIKLDRMKLSFDQRRLKNKLNQYIYEMKLLEKDIKQRLREINEWVEISSEFEKGCEHSTSSYDEHTYSNHFLSLKNLMDKSKNSEERMQYLSQLNTFLRLLGKEQVK